jgi:hypothetical protein
MYTCRSHTSYCLRLSIENHKQSPDSLSRLRGSWRCGTFTTHLQYIYNTHHWDWAYPQGEIQTPSADILDGPYAFSWVKQSHILSLRRRHVALQLTGRESLTRILNTSILFWSCMWVSGSSKMINHLSVCSDSSSCSSVVIEQASWRMRLRINITWASNSIQYSPL